VPRMPSQAPIALAAALLTVALSGAAACAGSDAGEAPVPEEIHGFPLAEVKAGEDAAAVLEGMHGKEVAPDRSWVATYGPEEMGTTLYVSRYESAETATSELARMAAGVDGEGTGFGHHAQFEVAGLAVHSVFGRGQIHYFYAKDRDLVWLGMVPMLARVGVAQLLNVPPDSIPPFGAPAAAATPSGSRPEAPSGLPARWTARATPAQRARPSGRPASRAHAPCA